MVFGILKGLNFLHAQGIVHGALSMTTVLFNEKFEPKLSDYGILRLPIEHSIIFSSKLEEKYFAPE